MEIRPGQRDRGITGRTTFIRLKCELCQIDQTNNVPVWRFLGPPCSHTREAFERVLAEHTSKGLDA